MDLPSLLRRAAQFHQSGNLLEAGRLYEQILAREPKNLSARQLLALVRFQQSRDQDALDEINQALATEPNSAEALAARGNILTRLERLDDALADFDRAIAAKPDYAEALYNRGNCLALLGRFEDAVADYSQAIALYPDYQPALTKRGDALRNLGRPAEALESFNRALTLKPDDPAALFGRGTLQWMEFGRYAPALRDLERVVSIAPDYDYARGNLIHLKMYGGDWRGFEFDKAQLDQGVRVGKRVVEPFIYQALSESPADLLACAKIRAALYPPGAPVWKKSRHPHRKIRVGYLSGEFRAHATQYLAAGLYERHDRKDFDIIAFDAGESDQSPMRERLEAAFDKFIGIAKLNDREAAMRIAHEEIDILVNLNGYFGKERTGVFALRPAPVQVNYLGFPGTMGAPTMDYLLADRVVIPASDREFYTEQVIWLPDCYQVNDDKRRIAEDRPSRAAEGLPDQGFVFCNFNQGYKLTPETFARWMRLVRSIEGSVLWLRAENDVFSRHLRQKAQRHGVAGERLIFARSLPLDRHLARLSLADLAIDSLPYNAHTTASDALWAGVPLLTCRGRTFPGRVAASLLTAVGLPELITEDTQAYEALALRLAREPPLLKSFRQRLAQNRATHPLFDTDRFRRHLEAAYRQMWEIAQRGEAPRHFAIPA